ncbi:MULTISPECIES: acyltransferase [unclassified Duganella]|uniref:acyltransferase family protein n=1 Tax=unclassified Duganella TaxID=2636909 RepID=UPI000E3426F0|nr:MULTISPECIES: acyltransferase [unclassified Duganella]RFP10724.1 acyltransferase [Duganella sp. BJB475]RFP27249.1 acyltransferase [Duganella sp. BJB476]
MTTPRTLAAAIESNDNSFNLVRLVAALLVVLYHAGVHRIVAPGPDPLSALLPPTADIGALAVDVFFVLSGLFITQSWMRDPDLPRFIARRVTRLVPGLFVCLALTTIVAVIFFSAEGIAGLADPAPWRYIFNGAMLHWLVYIIPPAELALPKVLGGAPLNGSLWTVYWEGRMYVMVALIGFAAILPMRRWMMAMSLILAVAAFQFPTVLAGYVWEARLWTLFLSGMLLQTLAAHVRFGPRQFIVACVLLALNSTRWLDLEHQALTVFGVNLVCITLALWVGSSQMLRWRHLQRHDYSYAIYIYHWPVMIMLKNVLPPSGIWTMLAATLAIVLPLSVFSWHFVEAPALAYVRAALKRRRAIAAAAA